ncbi:MFS transporter [Virgisporangium ochraceum]|uniref:MFS transporter n=2 Tax=Virgisporangium ochraceum TaxID=65505 RepID=A0A8J4A2S9_9ACTN|nr:MFS transporter [Virgisporangium ochraceum]
MLIGRVGGHHPGMISSTRAAEADPTVHDPRRRRAVLVAVCVALMAVIASVSGLNVAQQQVAVAFDASQGTVLWMINVYTLSLAALLLPLGALGDRWGRRPVLLAGLAVFGVAGAAAGLATSSVMMIVARLAGGVGAAMIMPVTLAVITSTFPPGDRARAIGVWTGVAGGGGILGMYLSAVLVDAATWRWLFALPVVLVGVAAVLALRSVPDSRERSPHRFDAVGSLLSVVAVTGLIVTLHEGPVRGWTDPATLVGLALGVAGSIAFVAWELRRPGPLLDVRSFRDRRLSSGSLALLVLFGVQAGIFVVLFPYLQAVLGWSGLRSTLALMPMAGVMMLAAGLAPRVAARAGSRATMAAGALVGGAGLALMATMVSVGDGYLSVLPGMLAMGLGMGLTQTPSTEAITSALPRERQGVASALNDVTRELGTALGVALLGAVLTAGYRAAVDARVGPVPARDGIATALATGDGALVVAARQAFVDGWRQAMWVGVAVMAALFAYVVARGPSRDAGSGAPGR